MASSYVPSLSAFTCVSCGKLVFASSQEQKDHFRSDYHRFNLKRKSVGLPPVTLEAYNAKMNPPTKTTPQAQPKKKKGAPPAKKAPPAKAPIKDEEKESKETVEPETKDEEEVKQEEEETPAASDAPTEEVEEEAEGEEGAEEEEEKQPQRGRKKVYRYSCAVCNKRFRSYRGFNVHYDSRGHFARAMAAGVSPEPPAAMAELAKQEEDAHAAKYPLQHPERFTEEELRAAIESRPRMAENECLFCGVVADSLEACLGHMADEHGFYVPDLDYCVDLAGLVRYLADKISVWTRCLWCPDTARSFYTTEAARQHMREVGHCKMAFELDDMPEYARFYDWSACPFPRGDGVPRPPPFLVSESGYELMLPSGRVVGHRELKTIFAQRYKEADLRVSVLANLRAQAARLRIAQAAYRSGDTATASALVPSAGIRPVQTAQLTRAQYHEKTRAVLAREGKMRQKLDRNSKKIVHIEFYC